MNVQISIDMLVLERGDELDSDRLRADICTELAHLLTCRDGNASPSTSHGEVPRADSGAHQPPRMPDADGVAAAVARAAYRGSNQ